MHQRVPKRSGRVFVIALVLLASPLVSAPALARTNASPAVTASSFTVPTTLDFPVQESMVGNNCLHAWLRVEPYGLADRTVHFALFGVPIASATTDQFGYATTCAVFPLSVGTYPGAASAAFAGDGLFGPSSAANDFVVFGKETHLTPTGGGGVYLETVTLGARLTFTFAYATIPYPCVPSRWNWCVLTATLPLQGRTIFFYRLGVLVGSAVTDDDGYAVLANISLNGLNAHQYENGFTAAFKGDAFYAPATFTTTLFVEPQTTSLLVTPGSGPSGGSTTLSALLRFDGGLPLADRLVVFYVNDAVVGTATTGSNGVATLEGVSLAEVVPGTYASAVKALFLGELNFYPTAGSATLTVSPAASAD